jgi:hypothetical protein
MKGGILGENALIAVDKMQFSAALGMKVPLPSREDSIREPDQHLWGTVIQLYYDYVFHPIFTLNAFMEWNIYPYQWADTPNYAEGAVGHYFDMVGELEGRFQYPLETAGLNLYWGVPLRFSLAPFINTNDANAGDLQYCFTTGLYAGLGFMRTPEPIELFVRYAAPAAGKNDQPIHRVSLLGRVALSF